MKQFFKSTLMVAGIAVATAFAPASAAPHSRLPFLKPLSVSPHSFSVELGQNENSESVHFLVRNHLGNRLRCTLKGPDGMILETVYLKARTGETTRNYVFDSAEEGIYSIEVTDGKERIVKKIDLRRVSPATRTEFLIQ